MIKAKNAFKLLILYLRYIYIVLYTIYNNKLILLSEKFFLPKTKRKKI